jgi:hypothetical protein
MKSVEDRRNYGVVIDLARNKADLKQKCNARKKLRGKAHRDTVPDRLRLIIVAWIWQTKWDLITHSGWFHFGIGERSSVLRG